MGIRSRAAAAAATGLAAAAVVVFGAATVVANGTCQVPHFVYKHGSVTFAEHGGSTQVRVEIADTPEAQEIGLMCRTGLDPDAGMLFAFADDTSGSFWMKDTLIPLSIAFIDASWHIVGIMDMKVEADPAHPDPRNLYAPPRPYRYALEVNQGFFVQHDIDAGAQIAFLAGEPATHP
jgi:uncharacterized protein